MRVQVPNGMGATRGKAGASLLLLFACVAGAVGDPSGAFAQSTATIRIFAGGGTADRDTLATAVRLLTPVALAVDGQGNVFIVDSRTHRVSRVDGKTGVLTTVAGSGDFGFDGDGGPATRALLNRPFGVAVDGQGTVFIADRNNRRVRRVDARSGTISTYAGTGQAGFGGDGGPAALAQFFEIVGLAVDTSGNLLVVDGGTVTATGGIQGNHRIRRIDAATGIVSTIAGSGIPTYSGDGGPATAAALSFPAAVTVDGAGRVLIADAGNHRVRAVDPTTGRITTVAGVGEDPFTGEGTFGGDGGPAVSASLNAPAGLATDPAGNLFIADQGNHRVRRVDARTGTIVTVAGTGEEGFSGDGGPAFLARISLPAGLALLPSGDLAEADLGNGLVRRVSGPSVLSPYAQARDTLDFGNVTAETARIVRMAVRNRGNAVLSVQGVRSDSPVFTTPDTSLSLAPGDSASISVTFNPVNAGRAEGRLTIASDDPRGPVRVVLRGQGAVPDVDVTADSLDFGPVVVGKADTVSITVYNFGIGQLFIRSATLADPQFMALDTVFALTSGQVRGLRVVYSPRTVGERLTALTVRTNDPDEGVVTVKVRGVGRQARPGGFKAIGDSAGLGGAGREFGVAWGDYNGDGRPDLYVVRSGGRASSLYRNDGGGKFADVAGPAGVTNDRDGSGAVWGDFDNDGDPDLFVTNFNQVNRLYRNDGNGAFSDIAPAVGLETPGGGMGASWADLDNDGDLDLFVAGFGPCRLYRNEGGKFVDSAPAFGVVDSLGSSVQPTWGDYDGDGRIDLFVAASGKDHLYHNEGSRFRDVGDSLRVTDTAPSFGAAWGDYDGDGDLDLFVTGFNSPCHLYRNDGTRFSDVGARLLTQDDGTWKARGAAWVDLDNDGDLDLFLVRSGQSNLLFRNDGAVFVEVGAKMGVDTKGDGRGAAAADFDGDGAQDLYVTYQDRPGRLFQNLQAEGGWVSVQLVGTRSARDAIGSRVRTVVGGRASLQEVSGGSSHLSQNGAALLFGLGLSERADSIVVRWPSGIVQVLKGIREGQVARIVETAPSPPARVSVLASAARLMANGTSVSRVEATVVDAVGERFFGSRALIRFSLVAGPGALVGPTSVQAQDGVASVVYRSAVGGIGRGVISAESDGLAAGQYTIELLAVPQAGAVERLAGVGQTAGREGDNGPADRALLGLPEGVVVADTTGTVYIADTDNNVIRRVDGRTRVITTVAGTGSRGNRGDGGPALSASLNTPSSVAMGPAGRLLIVDTGSHTIRQVDPGTGIITALAGNGTFGFGGDGGPATEAQLGFPASAAFDRQGNLYIADSFNHRVRRVDATNGAIVTVAGDGQARFAGDNGLAQRASLNRPSSVTVDSLGNLLIADTNNHRIRRVDGVTRVITTVAGDGRGEFSGDGGPAPLASLNGPWRVSPDSSGNLLIADTGNHRIRVVDGRTGLISTLAGTGNGGYNGVQGQDATKIDLNTPRGLGLGKPGEVYIADTRNDLIRILKVPIQAPPTGTLSGADFDGDGLVALTDFFLFAMQFGTREGGTGWDARFDLAKDGGIDFADFFAFAQQFGGKTGKPSRFSP